jgi:CDP-diacylglycerol--serine O-phosphatidyltransferase
MRAYASAANAMTSVGLAAGFGALLLAAEGRLGWAAVAIAVAAVLDLLDGPVARRNDSDDRFGAELDSLTDLVAFAVAPAILLYEAAAGLPRPLAAAVSLGFVLAGAWRLARFPILQCTDRFAGLPTPPSGLLLAIASLGVPAGGVLALAVALALLMVSTTPFPTLGGAIALLTRRTAGARDPLSAAAGSAPPPGAAAQAVSAGEFEADPPPRRRRRPALRVRVGRGGMVRVARRARRLPPPRDELLTGADARD